MYIPSVVLLEGLRQQLQIAPHLRRAREAWWRSLQRVCLANKLWSVERGLVVTSREQVPDAIKIKTARFDPLTYRTVLQLTGHDSPLEILL